MAIEQLNAKDLLKLIGISCLNSVCTTTAKIICKDLALGKSYVLIWLYWAKSCNLFWTSAIVLYWNLCCAGKWWCA